MHKRKKIVGYLRHLFDVINPFPNKPSFLCTCSTSLFKNTVVKGEIARYEQFLLFPQCFLPIWRTFLHFHQTWNCRLQSLSVWKSLKSVVWERVKDTLTAKSKQCGNWNAEKWKIIPFQPLPLNLDIEPPWGRNILKTLSENEKMLSTGIFSFSYNLFYTFKDIFCCFGPPFFFFIAKFLMLWRI